LSFNSSSLIAGSLMGLATLFQASAVIGAEEQLLPSVLDQPALISDLASAHLLTDLTNAGERLVAVGERGHIVYSDNQGESWQQAAVPSSVLLTGVSFPTPEKGWAVGHGGLILHSTDAGETWQRQLDGRGITRLLIKAREAAIIAMEQTIEQAPEDEQRDLEWALDDLRFSLETLQAELESEPVNPLLDVWFADELHGFAIGAYGAIIETLDGGESWRARTADLENPQGFHLNAFENLGNDHLIIAGEAGQIFISADLGNTWTFSPGDYEGSLFGALPGQAAGEVLAFGLRGTLLYSTDYGQSWQSLKSPTEATINRGYLNQSGQPVLVGNGGAILRAPTLAGPYTVTYESDRQGLMGARVYPDDSYLLIGESGVLHKRASADQPAGKGR